MFFEYTYDTDLFINSDGFIANVEQFGSNSFDEAQLLSNPSDPQMLDGADYSPWLSFDIAYARDDDAQETWSYGDCVDPRELGAPPVDDLSLAPPSPLAVSPVSVEANETGDFEEEPVAGPSRQAACAKSAAEGSGAAGLVTTTQDEHTDEVPRTPLRTPLQMVRRQTRSVTKRLESAASSRREIEPVTPSPPRVSKKRKAMDEEPSSSTSLGSTAQNNNTLVTPAASGRATRRRKLEDGNAAPAPSIRSSTRAHAVPALVRILGRYPCSPYADTHKGPQGQARRTPCLMCGHLQLRRDMNDIAHSHRSAKPNNRPRMPWCRCLQDLDVQYPAPRKSAYKHTNIARFGIGLLWRYPQVLNDAGEFVHDQIKGYALRDLTAWWAEQVDLQEARANGTLKAALKVAAAESGIEMALASRVPAQS